tara:strand:+ start:1227 stop:1595 length:369 start_codon:yes stop_codon:yes gene_type:complete
MLNNCTFTGNVGKDLSYSEFTSKSGELVEVGEFSVAVNSKKNNEDQTMWITCHVYGGLLKTKWMNHIKKGNRIAVNGPITVESYLNKTDSTPTHSIKLRVNSLDPLTEKRDTNSPDNSPPFE